jgi:hypothetical protein
MKIKKSVEMISVKYDTVKTKLKKQAFTKILGLSLSHEATILELAMKNSPVRLKKRNTAKLCKSCEHL